MISHHSVGRGQTPMALQDRRKIHRLRLRNKATIPRSANTAERSKSFAVRIAKIAKSSINMHDGMD